MANVAVVGLGYVGLTTALGLAKIGHQVVGVESDVSRLQALMKGELPIHEPGLAKELFESLENKRLTLSGQLEGSAEDSDIFFVCVSTPLGISGRPDLGFVVDAFKGIQEVCNPYSIIVLKSTVPVGTGDFLSSINSFEPQLYASNPEFLREGRALYDFMNPDRIIVGANTSEIAEKVLSLYEHIDAPKFITSVKSAELIKYAANAYLATRLSFVNDMAALCEQIGVNVDDLIKGLGSDSRIGDNFLNPGPGWGGSCFPKDTRALVTLANDNNVLLSVVEAAIEANENAFDRVVSRLSRLLDGELEGKVVGIFGLAFKANTDDTRDSPSLEIVTRLLDLGCTIRAFDPIASGPTTAGFTQTSSVVDAATGADAILVLTEWDEFRDIDPIAVSKVMRGSVVLDTRRVLIAESWKKVFSNFSALGVTDQ
jgi:UDPglucose 6-dehydrogenase